MTPAPPELSVIIPVFNEAESIARVHAELMTQLDGTESEIIYVDDGSRDGTDAILESLCTNSQIPVTLTVLYTRSGKASAQATGISHARGQYIVFMDGDGQDVPADIPELQKALKAHEADMVVGWRQNRQSSAFFCWISWVFNWLIRTFMGLHIRDINASLKIVRARFVRDIPLYAGHYRFLPILLHQKGLKVIERPVRHRARAGGVSKYSAFKALGGGLDLFTIFFLMHSNLSPLRFFGSIGVLLMLPGLLACGYITVLKVLFGHILGHYPLLLMAILFILSGMQLICTGLLAELIVFRHSDHHPLPLVRRNICNFRSHTPPAEPFGHDPH
jgi:glycosyltransferase involved in cell wall biosynthesis